MSSTAVMMATGRPHLLDDEELLQRWDFCPTVKAFVNAQQRPRGRIRRTNSTRDVANNANSEITTSMALIELNHWSVGHRASHCNDADDDDDYSVFLTHPPVLLLPPSATTTADAGKCYHSSSSSSSSLSSEDAILSNTGEESIIIIDELIDESVLLRCCRSDDENDTPHPCCNDTNEQRQRLSTSTTITTTGRSDAARSISSSSDVRQQRAMSNNSGKSWYTEWTFNIVYHPTYHVPTLYFTACHLDGTVLTIEDVMHTLQQYQRYQHFQSSIDDEANNDDSGNELHNNMDERGSNDHDEGDVKYYHETTTEDELHLDEFISHEEHPITGMPCYCIHPCRTTDRMQYISSSASIAGTTTSSSSVMEDEEEEEQHHDPNVNATAAAATSVPLLLSWMSMILPIVGCCLSSYTYQQLVVSVIDEKQKMQQQQQKKKDGMETSLRLQQKDTIETIDELKVTEEDGVIIDNIVDQDGAAIQSSSYSNTTVLNVNDDNTTPITTTTTTTTSDEYDKGEQQPQQRRHQTINPILHTSFLVAIVIFCCYIAQSNTRPLSSSSIPPMLLFTYANNDTIAASPHQQQRVLDGNYYYYYEYDCKHCSQRKRWRRKLRAMPGDATNNLINEGGSQQRSTNSNNEKDNNNKLTIVGGVQINMLRRAKDIVSNTDVPFLLQLPSTHHEILYDIMTQCYGLTPRQYLSLEELSKAKENNILNSHYVNFHDIDHHEDHRRAGRSYFHFFATPYYTQGVELLTLMHKGRIIAMLCHPVLVAEEMYVEYLQSKQRRMTTATMKTSASSLSFDYTVQDVLHHVNSTNYYDNQLTRMLVNIPPDVKVTEELFREARMILENKFLIGMSYDLIETIQKRLSLYFGWKEIETKAGCEVEHILTGQQTISSSTNKLLIVEGSPQWKFVAKHNRYDVKLYARAMAVFGDQKMRVPIHSYIRAEETAVVDAAFFSGHLLDITEPRADTDIPFFWHIPKASGTTVKETLSDCYGLVRTEMIRPPSSLEIIPETKVLNVDLSTPEAIASARRENMVDRGLANVIVSQLGLEGSTLFTTLHQGRAFTILRHPVKLAVSLFYYRRIATWEPTYRPEYKDITLQEYVERDGYYDNWMVRMLTNAKIGGLNEGHLDLAKTILKRKFIIGISDQMTETFRRLEMFFGWKEGKAGCVDFHLNAAPSNKNKYPELDQDDLVWTIISTKNKYDMALYYYALELCESHLS